MAARLPLVLGSTGEVQQIQANDSLVVPTSTSGEVVLAANVNFTLAAGVFQDTGMSVTLPVAGTYLITANVRVNQLVGSGGGWCGIYANLWNKTDAPGGPAIFNSTSTPRLIEITSNTSGTYQATYTLSWIISVPASKVINMIAFRYWTGSAPPVTSQFVADSSGWTTFNFVRLA